MYQQYIQLQLQYEFKSNPTTVAAFYPMVVVHPYANGGPQTFLTNAQNTPITKPQTWLPLSQPVQCTPDDCLFVWLFRRSIVNKSEVMVMEAISDHGIFLRCQPSSSEYLRGLRFVGANGEPLPYQLQMNLYVYPAPAGANQAITRDIPLGNVWKPSSVVTHALLQSTRQAYARVNPSNVNNTNFYHWPSPMGRLPLLYFVLSATLIKQDVQSKNYQRFQRCLASIPSPDDRYTMFARTRTYAGEEEKVDNWIHPWWFTRTPTSFHSKLSYDCEDLTAMAISCFYLQPTPGYTCFFCIGTQKSKTQKSGLQYHIYAILLDTRWVQGLDKIGNDYQPAILLECSEPKQVVAVVVISPIVNSIPR